jgi:hypothetical protein
MKYIKLFEDFSDAKFSIEDVENWWKSGKKIFASVIKDFPKNNSEEPLEIFNVDSETGVVGVLIDGQPYYVDLENIERAE